MLAPLLFGIALGDLLHGLPINSAQNFTGSFWDLFQPYAVFTGVTLVLVCMLHGANFLCLKTTTASTSVPGASRAAWPRSPARSSSGSSSGRT